MFGGRDFPEAAGETPSKPCCGSSCAGITDAGSEGRLWNLTGTGRVMRRSGWRIERVRAGSVPQTTGRGAGSSRG